MNTMIPFPNIGPSMDWLIKTLQGEDSGLSLIEEMKAIVRFTLTATGYTAGTLILQEFENERAPIHYS